MVLLILTIVAFLSGVMTMLGSIASFNNQVEKHKRVEQELVKSFKLRMVISGLMLAASLGFLAVAIQGVWAGLITVLFWSVLLGGGLFVVASKTVMKFQKKYDMNR